MLDRNTLWTPTAALYAIALGLFAVSLAIGQTGSYHFAPGPVAWSMWRGDARTGRMVLCTTESGVAQASALTGGAGAGIDVRRC